MPDVNQPKYIIAMYDDGYAEYAINYPKALGPFKPVTENFINNLAISGNATGLYGKIPKNVIGYSYLPSGYSIAFTTEACTKKLYFKNNKTEKSIDVDFPKMLWLYKENGSLFIYAISQKKAYLINMNNVYDSNLCIGTSPHPTSKQFEKAVEEIKAMFFEGTFLGNFKNIKINQKGVDLWKLVDKHINTY